MKQLRLAVTGVGLVTPLGQNSSESWQRIIKGDAAGRLLTVNDFNARTTIEAETWFGAPAVFPSSSDQPTCSRTRLFALSAAREAWIQSGLSEADKHGTACVIGTSKTDLSAVDQLFCNASVETELLRDSCACDGGLSFVENLFPTSQDVNMCSKNALVETEVLYPSEASSAVAADLVLSGPQLSPIAACATGLVSMIRAAELIRHGDAQCAIAGSTDTSLHPGLLASYRRLGVLAKSGGSPEMACRPFDQNRTGFIVGEGAGAAVLESWESARARGVRPLAEWIDGITGSDPTAMTSVDTSGQVLAELIGRLLDRNNLHSDQVSVICYHGTATEQNDLAEANAIHQAFPHSPIGFGVKGAIGHLMGAAGSVETAFSVLSLQDQLIPPTRNHERHDPDCPNRLSGSTAIRQPIEYLIKTSLGFGGHVAVGLLKKAT